MRDFRWERLTAAAAASTTGPRTAATGEIRMGVQCCQCRGQLDQEHEAPEHPLPIIPGRPVGWMTCPHCRLSYGTLDNGARIQHHSCNSQNREGQNRSQQIKELDNQQGPISPDLVLLHTDDVPSNYPGTWHLWSGGKKEHKGKGLSSFCSFLLAPVLPAEPKLWVIGLCAAMVDVEHRAGM